MNIFSKISRWLGGMARVFANEFRIIFHDAGVLLFFVALPLLYPVVYTLMYNPEVVENIPVAVVDNSRTADSREFVRRASATPAIKIYDYCADMGEARRLMAEGKVFGIIEIPSDYAKNIGRSEVANVSFFADMSLLLRYRAFVGALTDLQLNIISEITAGKIAEMGAQSLAGDAKMPVNSESNFLGDTEQGFASFVIPGIVILIMQQSMLLGICLIGGTSRERRGRNGGIDPEMVQGVPATATVWGKAFAYTVFYLPLMIYMARIVPEMFDLPHYGHAQDYLLFIFPMLLATAFLGQTLNVFMKERESSFVLLVVTSVIFLFLSGLTWPRYAMSDFWTWVGNLVPATWGVEGFIRINSNAGSLAEQSRPFLALWILAALYMVMACLITKWIDVTSRARYKVRTDNVPQ